MKIAVIAANGRTGSIFVDNALSQGHIVKAGVYGGTISARENLEIVNCNAMNYEEVVNLIKGCDAVVSFIGHVKGSSKTVQTDAIKNAISAMKAENIKRLVSLTGTGVRLPGDNPSIVDKILNLAVNLVDPYRINDGIMHAKILRDSGLDWTLIRVLKLQNTTPKIFSLKLNGPAKLITSRFEVAEATLQVISDPDMIHRSPIICNP